MAVKEILKMGHPLLWQEAKQVDCFGTPELEGLFTDLQETLLESGGVGLAAPQIGVSLQAVIFEVKITPDRPEITPVPYTELINPILTPLGDEMEDGWEGCLSVPGLKGLVPRYKRIRYTGLDSKGQKIEREVEGFHARVVQHETDHLWGRLYPSLIRDWQKFGFISELTAQH